MRIGAAIQAAVKSTAKEWSTHKRQKIRDERTVYKPEPRWMRGEKYLNELAFEIMPQAYAKAAGSVGLANARQIYYVARELILNHPARKADDELKANYFTQTLLPQYIEDHPDETAQWDVVYDARGHLQEPHTGILIGLGTLEVRDYIAGWTQRADADLDGPRFEARTFPAPGPHSRYRNVLFVEKEGFDPILHRAQIAARFDVAIMSTKGMSVTAARQLVEALTEIGARVLVVRDFDKAGFSIAHTLAHDTRRYQFTVRPNVVDLGLRLVDAGAEHLPREKVTYVKQRDPAANLRENGATKDEVDVLVSHPRTYVSWAHGERVELNAFTSDQFVAWLERKLTQHGVRKFIPEAETLEAAYRRAIMIHTLNAKIEEAREAAGETAEQASVPKSLLRQVRRLLKEHPTVAWDAAVARIAEAQGFPVRAE